MFSWWSALGRPVQSYPLGDKLFEKTTGYQNQGLHGAPLQAIVSIGHSLKFFMN